MNDFELEILKKFGSKKKCCDFMHWSPATLSKIKSKKRPLTTTEILKLNDIFKIDSMQEFKKIFFNF